MKIRLLWAALFSIFITMPGCSTNPEANRDNIELTVSAAASLNEALGDIEQIYEKENENIDLLFNFGGSGSLQQQIIQGAPVDLFFSAAKAPFDQLADQNLILSKYSTDLIGNELALIIPKQSNLDIANIKDLVSREIDRIAIGTPEAVPAGQYSMQVFKQLQIDDQLAEKLIPAKDVRQVLSYVETNNVDAGIVYMTDANSSDKVKIAAKAEASQHDPIVYPVGVLENTPQLEEAIVFFEFLKSEAALEIFKKHGFKILD